MSNFDKLFEKFEQNDPGEIVQGAFMCQHQGCTLDVDEALYVRELKYLSWVCYEGHKSYIEEISL